jgi:aminomuconate-semialdehyde/2-hydroxymuconate-6-semialdehyde dehydrogenase
MKFIHNYIGGDLVAPATGKYIDCFNPALGSVYAQIPDSDKSDVETAISAAEAAFVDWSNLKRVMKHLHLQNQLTMESLWS